MVLDHRKKNFNWIIRNVKLYPLWSILHFLRWVCPDGVALAEVPSENVWSALLPDLVQETVDRIRNAAEMGDVTDLTAIAEELKLKSDSFLPLAEKIIQLAENFEFESITNFVASLEKTAKRK